jgi:acyl carrier protein
MRRPDVDDLATVSKKEMTMPDQNIEEVVIKSLRELGCDAERILPIHNLQGDLGVDSTEMIELAALVRTEFGLNAQRIDLHEVVTVADLSDRVKSLLDRINSEEAVHQNGGDITARVPSSASATNFG